MEVNIIFGKEAIDFFDKNGFLTEELKEINFKKYFFSTEIEKKAFLKGIEEAIGWNEALEVEEVKILNTLLKPQLKNHQDIFIDLLITVKVIESNQIITQEKVNLILE